ncbi:MAG: hypothetical protein AAGE43_14480 [Pseudomonadota bacterium]
MKLSQCAAAAVALLCTASVAASELMIYPNEDQDDVQQEQDNYQCYSWAKGESGFDPMALPTTTEPPPQQQAKRGGIGRGALRGAAVGGIIDGSDGAKTGAAVGAVVGGARRADQNRQQAQAQAQYEQEQVAQYEAARSSYNRAFAACMEGRGYTVR